MLLDILLPAMRCAVLTKHIKKGSDRFGKDQGVTICGIKMSCSCMYVHVHVYMSPSLMRWHEVGKTKRISLGGGMCGRLLRSGGLFCMLDGSMEEEGGSKIGKLR